MKKISIYMSAILLGAFFTSCGEAGVESNVSKVTEVTFTITENAPQININTGAAVVASQEIDPASEDFQEYLNDVEEYFINKITLQITSVNTSSPFDIDILNFGTGTLVPNPTFDNWLDNDLSTQEALVSEINVDNGNVGVGSEIVLYDRGNPSGGYTISDIEQKISAFLTKVKQQQAETFSLIVLTPTGFPSSYTLQVKMKLDLTARVQLAD